MVWEVVFLLSLVGLNAADAGWLRRMAAVQREQADMLSEGSGRRWSIWGRCGCGGGVAVRVRRRRPGAVALVNRAMIRSWCLAGGEGEAAGARDWMAWWPTGARCGRLEI